MPATRSRPRTTAGMTKTLGKSEPKSRSKANAAKARSNEVNETVDSEAWPRTSDGRPMIKILMTASELIPHGQFANISVGPAQITAFIDPQQGEAFSDEERENMAKALNQLGEVVEADVIAVQRVIVLDSIQQQAAGKGNDNKE